jgi:CRP-like cAMP-binding protein
MKNLSLIEKALLLKEAPLFAALDLEMLLPISDKMGALDIKRDTPLFSKGDEGKRLYLIVAGEVELSDGTSQATLGPGQFFGDEALVSGEPHAYSARCTEGSKLLALSQGNLLTILHECPSVAICLLEGYAKRNPFRHGK